MRLKATAFGALCLTALSLCLCWAAWCESNPPPPDGKSPGYFGKDPRGPFRSNDALLKEYYAAKKKGKARTKPKPQAK